MSFHFPIFAPNNSFQIQFMVITTSAFEVLFVMFEYVRIKTLQGFNQWQIELNGLMKQRVESYLIICRVKRKI